ncbi:hypothetical protein OESDEN_17054 [Oesophagostomum dentatum]|uniref:YitH acetyltransferase (GNAT) domain-containing protein n=1 Tax=Oesophagostomum dentatum TaxID=61180 RepID=A0A0B1SE98_OESDE|nr:hypothetical protein OESDEN_17054 [Oesophagostomum dentatum]
MSNVLYQSKPMVKRVTASTLPLMLDYDSSIQGDLDRSMYIQLFAMQPCADAKLAVCDGEAVGIGIARLLYNGELFIGPLYANTYVSWYVVN